MRILALALVLLAVPFLADAAVFPGTSDTGWSWYDKSECCADAIELAQGDSMFRCERAGGLPSTRFGLRRGNCKFRSNVDGYGARIYRCWGSAKVSCK